MNKKIKKNLGYRMDDLDHCFTNLRPQIVKRQKWTESQLVVAK